MFGKIKEIFSKKTSFTRLDFVVMAVIAYALNNQSAAGAYFFIAAFDWINENLLILSNNAVVKAQKVSGTFPERVEDTPNPQGPIVSELPIEDKKA